MVTVMRSFLKHRLWYGMVSILAVLLLGLLINEKNWRPLKNYADWQVSANFNPEHASWAIDRNVKTAWSSGTPMLSGMFFQVDLGGARRVNGLVFRGDKTPDPLPAEWILSISQDGIAWQKLTLHRIFTYKTLMVLTFPPVSARHLQLVQTSAQTSALPWHIHEIEILQPILPWQGSRATMLLWLFTWVIIAAVMLVYGHASGAMRNRLVLAVVLLAALAGWGLRVADLTVGELSVQEMQELSLADLGKDSHLHWIKSYYDNTQTGAGWLYLLLKRLNYDLFDEPFLALRSVSVLFSMAVVIMFPVFWRRIRRSAAASTLWEGVLSASILSVLCFAVWMSRQGNVASIFLGAWLLIIWIALRWMDRPERYGSLILLAIGLVGGYFLDPAMRYVSISLLLFHGVMIAATIGRAHHLRWSVLRKSIGRLAGIALAALPLWGYIWLWESRSSTPAQTAPFFAHTRVVISQIPQVWRLSGLGGLPGLVALGVTMFGVVRLFIRRHQDEWFFFVQGIVFSLLAWWRMASVTASPLLILVLLVIILFVKGLLALFEFIRLKPITIGVIVIGLGYLAGFSLNSLVGNIAWLPYAPVVRETSAQGMYVKTVLADLQKEEGKCAAVGTLDRIVADWYPALYAVHPILLKLEEAKRLATLGRFTPYLLASQDALIPEEQDFVHQYYTEIVGGRAITVYRLRSEWENATQRYTPADLQYDTGHHLNDDQSASGVVRFATPDDPPGRLASWPPFRLCQSGEYLARYALRSPGNSAEIVAILEVLDETHQVVARREVRGTEFVNPDAYQRFDLPCQVTFENPAFPLRRLLLLVHVTGAAEVRLDYLELARQTTAE